MNQQGNQPVKEFRIGALSAAIWKDQETQPDGNIRVRHSVRIQKRFRNRDGQWQNTEYYFANDLPKLRLVAGKAYEYVVLRESDTNAEQTTATE